MPIVHVMKTRAKPSYTSLEFATYNEAVAYMSKAAALNPSKPYKRAVFKGEAIRPVWFVTFRNPHQSRAEWQRFDTVPGYLGWHSLPCNAEDR
jgi:hypothetical protein